MIRPLSRTAKLPSRKYLVIAVKPPNFCGLPLNPAEKVIVTKLPKILWLATIYFNPVWCLIKAYKSSFCKFECHFQLFETSLNNDEQRQLVLSGIGNATAIAVDWIANNLYIVDAHGRQIHILAIDSGYQTSIIDNLMSPVDVAIDPGCG